MYPVRVKKDGKTLLPYQNPKEMFGFLGACYQVGTYIAASIIAKTLGCTLTESWLILSPLCSLLGGRELDAGGRKDPQALRGSSVALER
jgi:hypothetical protein